MCTDFIIYLHHHHTTYKYTAHIHYSADHLIPRLQMRPPASLRTRDRNNIPIRYIHVAPKNQIALIRLEVRLHCEGPGVCGLGADGGTSIAVGMELAWGVGSGREAGPLDGADGGVGSAAVKGILEIDSRADPWDCDGCGDGVAGITCVSAFTHEVKS